jgi:hypothetical protein
LCPWHQGKASRTTFDLINHIDTHSLVRFIQCKVCVRVYLLAYLHAKSCKRDDCSVLYCDEVRAALLDNKLKVSKVILQTFFLSLQKADST